MTFHSATLRMVVDIEDYTCGYNKIMVKVNSILIWISAQIIFWKGNKLTMLSCFEREENLRRNSKRKKIHKYIWFIKYMTISSLLKLGIIYIDILSSAIDSGTTQNTSSLNLPTRERAFSREQPNNYCPLH